MNPSRIDPTLGPIAEIPGIVPFTGELSQQGYRLSMFLVSLRDAGNRAEFAADEDAYMRRTGLDEHERGLVRRRDFVGMLAHGASVYAIGKGSGALGATLIEIGAAARGETVAQFLAGRPSA